MQGQLGQLHSCIACPGADGKTCQGRGFCFDDAFAKQVPQESTAALTATGNGTCHCHEVYFFGSDEAGRSSCIDGICPAGTEEKDGRCDPCSAGAASVAGDMCKKCLPGEYSLSGSASCSRCPAGTISEASGASACEACPAGRYELQQQFCQECSPGFISVRNSSYCTKCPAGFMAPESGSSTCIPCAGGSFSEEGSAQCQECSPGFISVPNSSYCSQCPAGSMAPKPGCSSCVPCGGGFFSDWGSSKCVACPSGKVSTSASGACRSCDAGFFSRDALTCEPCPSGTISKAGSSACQSCPTNEVSLPESSGCTRCEGVFLREVADATKQQCQARGMDVVVAIISWIATTGLSFLCFSGLRGSIRVEDLSAQGQKLVLTTSMMHWVLPWALPEAGLGEQPTIESDT